MKKFFLEVLTGTGKGRKLEIVSSLTLGRSRGNDLSFAGEEAGIVSARHALIALKGSSLWLRDMDSTNGTFVGKVRVTERELLGDEVISLGPMGPAMRVVVAEGGEIDEGAKTMSGASTMAVAPGSVGLLSDAKGGSKTLIKEMARKLKHANAPQDAVLGFLRDPERLERLLKGGVMPERVADWLGSVGGNVVKSRRRLIWIGGTLGVFALAGLSILGYQNHLYRGQLKLQGDLLGQINDLEQGLAKADKVNPAERSRLVHQLLAAEKQLFQIRGKLKLPDRAPTYHIPLGGDIHDVLEELGKKGFLVPDSFIESVREQIDYFCKPGNRATLQRCFARKPIYEKMIRRELARLKLPSDFFYIAMQESLLDSLAQSGNDARGLWQLVPVTAREYDLEVPDKWKKLPPSADPRTRPRAETKAAAKYLHLLYSEFGDAALAMAAYNAGAAKMRRVLRQIEDPVNDRDFWYLYRMGLLPDETNDYVPKIIAMILIDRNREKYGFPSELTPKPAR